MVVYYRKISEDILYFLSVVEFQTAYYFIWYSTLYERLLQSVRLCVHSVENCMVIVFSALVYVLKNGVSHKLCFTALA